MLNIIGFKTFYKLELTISGDKKFHWHRDLGKKKTFPPLNSYRLSSHMVEINLTPQNITWQNSQRNVLDHANTSWQLPFNSLCPSSSRRNGISICHCCWVTMLYFQFYRLKYALIWKVYDQSSPFQISSQALWSQGTPWDASLRLPHCFGKQGQKWPCFCVFQIRNLPRSCRNWPTLWQHRRKILSILPCLPLWYSIPLTNWPKDGGLLVQDRSQVLPEFPRKRCAWVVKRDHNQATTDGVA